MPVEIGSRYTEDDGTQKVMTVQEFENIYGSTILLFVRLQLGGGVLLLVCRSPS